MLQHEYITVTNKILMENPSCLVICEVDFKQHLESQQLLITGLLIQINSIMVIMNIYTSGTSVG